MKSSRQGKSFTIVVATDFSPTARHAFDTALRWASKLGARVSIVHVIKGAWSETEVAPGTRTLQSLKTAAFLKLGRLARLALETGVRADAHLATGNPAERILAYCRTHRVDLLVVGTQGRGGISRTLLGSVADELVRKVPCPVLTINPSVKGQHHGKRRRHPDD